MKMKVRLNSCSECHYLYHNNRWAHCTHPKSKKVRTVENNLSLKDVQQKIDKDCPILYKSKL